MDRQDQSDQSDGEDGEKTSEPDFTLFINTACRLANGEVTSASA